MNTSFYINKHIFSDTLYTDIHSQAGDLKKSAEKHEGAGITCYGNNNLIGRIKEMLGLAFKQNLTFTDESGTKITKAVYIDKRSLAEWKVAELNTRNDRKDNDLDVSFETIADEKEKIFNDEFPEVQQSYQQEVNKVMEFIDADLKDSEGKFEFLDKKIDDDWMKL